ncbi:glutamyl aminopeptidase-like isoform X2 [Formica exsecta]|uniref:glutamyl aminopeptidase-like isoform X2 n=1 Tax=Formica exsecta TaxID=72781 RepID=UPI0011423048|nr:glutamyl aminopeptidase-like isoform X2 [Formica exsecta]
MESYYRYHNIDMAFLRLLFYGGLIFITAIAFPIDENPRRSLIGLNYHFDNVVPAHYDVKLIAHFKEDQERDEIFESYKTDIEKYQVKGSIVFYGELKVAINIFHSTKKIRLSSMKSIHHLYGDLMKKDTMVVKYLVDSFKYEAATRTCVLHFNVELPCGSYILNIKFLNAINNTENIIIPLKNGLQNESVQYAWSEATHFQGIGARQLFPCWDKPTMKATFNISIKHHRKYKVFSNMPIQKEEIYKQYKTETHMNWTYFNVTPAISTHTVMLVITPITTLDHFRMGNIIIWYRPGLYWHIKYAQKIAHIIMLQMEIKWGNLKIPIVQFVAICGLLYENQNWGLVLNRETNIMYDKNLHSVAHKINIARLIGREITYQWFGNLVDPLWLIDGLSMLFGIDTLNSIEDYRHSEMLDLFIVQVQFDSLRLDTLPFIKPVIAEDNHSEISFFSHYIKAPLILRMLQYLITDEVFRESVYLYLHKHVLNSTTPDDFWTVMKTAIDEAYDNPYIEEYMPPLKTMVYNCWISCIGYPVLEITRDYYKNSMKIAIYKNIKNCDTFEDLFWIPVTYTTQNETNFRNLKHPLYDQRLIVMRSDKPSKHVIINETGWVIFNLQQAGYYRVNYDPENWQKIAKYLNSKEFTKIHVLNRAKIIDDAFYFMVKHQLDSSIFWKLTNYLTRETNYIAWYPMIKVFEYMSSVFPLPNEGVQNIKDKITRMLRFLLRNINYEEDSEENDLTKCLRQEAIKWACILNDLNCQMVAHDRLLERIQMLKTNKLLPWWEEWIYCKGLMLANSLVIWQGVINISTLENKGDRFSEFLACAPSNFINKSLEILFEDNEYLNSMEVRRRINSFCLIIAKHAKHHNVLSNILKNFYTLKPRGTDGIALFIAIVNHVYSKEQLDKIRENMRNIIEAEVYRIHYKRICKKIFRCFLEDTVIEQHFRMYKDIVEQWMLYAERKLQMRLFEIERQISYLQTFLE